MCDTWPTEPCGGRAHSPPPDPARLHSGTSSTSFLTSPFSNCPLTVWKLILHAPLWRASGFYFFSEQCLCGQAAWSPCHVALIRRHLCFRAVELLTCTLRHAPSSHNTRTASRHYWIFVCGGGGRGIKGGANRTKTVHRAGATVATKVQEVEEGTRQASA